MSDGWSAFWSSFLQVTVAAANANAVVTMIVVLGVLATMKGVFDQKGISDMGKLVYHISLPALLLVNILREVTFANLRKLWILPFFCSVHISLAWLVGTVMSRFLQLDDVEQRPVLATVMFGNVGALAIAVMKALCSEKPFNGSQFGGAEGCAATSTSYIAFYLITQNIWMFTWGERILIKKAQQAKEEVYVPGADSSPSKKLLANHHGDPKKIIVSVPSLSSMITASNSNENLESAGAPKQLPDKSQNEDDLQVEPRSGFSRQTSPFSPTFKGALRNRTKALSDHDLVSLELRLTRQAVQEVGSRMPLEVKPWSAEYHGGTDAIMAAVEDELEEEDSSPGLVGRRRSYTLRRLPSLASDDGLCVRMKKSVKTKLINLWNRVWSTVKRWSFRRCYRGTRRRLINFFRALRAMSHNPPLQAATIALAIGLCPPLKGLFYSSDEAVEAPLRSVYSAIAALGSAQVPVSMLMLSGSGTLRYLKKEQKLVEKEVDALEGPAPLSSFSFSKRAVFVMIFGRLLGVPLLGFLSWYAMKELGWMPRDPLLGFIVLIESAVPSAQNVVMLLLVHGELAQGSAMAEVILQQYAVAVPIFTFITSIFAYLIADRLTG